VAVLLGLVALVPFLPAVTGEFLSLDDWPKLRDNPAYRGLGWTQLRWMWTTGYTGLYQPIAWMAWGLDYVLWGLAPVGYHLTSLAWHGLTVALVFVLARELLAATATGRHAGPAALTGGAALAALAFGLHPLRVEPVAWISARGDVLAGALLVGATLAHLRACRAGRPGGRAVAGALFAAALLAKASAILWPIALLALDAYPLARLGRATGGWLTRAAGRRYLEKLPYAAIAVVLAAIAARTKAVTDSMLPPPAGDGPAAALARFAYSAAFYVRTTLWPRGLAPFYERPSRLDPLAAPFLLSGLAVVTITGAALLLRRRRPALLTAWVIYLLLLAPSSGVVAYGSQLVAARYSYVACLPWAVLVGAAVPMLAMLGAEGRRHRALAAATGAAAGLALAWLGAASWALAGAWTDSDRFWTSTLAVAPRTAIAHIELGLLAERRGDLAAGDAHFRQALELWPGQLRDVTLARVLEQEGHHAAAAAHYRRALGRNPESRTLRLALGRALLRADRPADAAAVLRETTARFPDWGPGHALLGIALAAESDLAGAAEAFAAVVRLEPDSAVAHHNLGLVLARQGRAADAMRQLERALALDPTDAAARAGLDALRELRPGAPDPQDAAGRADPAAARRQ
jgi:tetratricopeptide (TPR) repeat protein